MANGAIIEEKTDIRDFLRYRYPTNLSASPDEQYVAFAVVEPSEEEDCYHSCLWLYCTKTGKYEKLTRGNRERNFVWTDSETILFTGNRESGCEEGTGLYAIKIHGGEAYPITFLPYDVRGIQYQNGALYLLVHERYRAREKDFEIFDELPFWNNGVGITNKVRDRLCRYDLKSGEVKMLSPEYGQVEAYWAENGTVFFTCNTFTDVKMPQCGLYEYLETDQRVEEVLAQGEYSITYACRRNGFVDFMGSDRKRYGYSENPRLYRIKNGEPLLLADYDYSTRSGISCDCRMPGGTLQATVGGDIYVISNVGIDMVLQRFDLDGNVSTVIGRPGTVEMFAVCDKKIYFIGMRDQGLQELYCMEDGKESRLTFFGEEILNSKMISKVEYIRYSHKGIELDGFVMKPVGYQKGTSYPGILTIHGGPKGTYGALFSHEFQVYAAAGYFVFYTNPIGSDGRGNEFADITAKQGTIDYEELMAFTDLVLEKYPDMDQNRLGVMGISYGGFMTNWIIGHTNRFKAAVPQCSIANWISKTNTTDIGYCFNTSSLGGDVWGNHDKMWELSPLKYADRVTTPTLIIHCDEDYRCHLTEGLQMFTALKYHGVPAKLFLIHGESHGVSRIGKPKKRIRRLEEILEWLRTYLG